MTLVLTVAGWSIFALAVVAGLALDIVGLFGNWVILGAVAGAWLATGFAHFGVWTLVILAALATLGEIIEMIAAGYGASRFGGNKRTLVAAILGCVLGAMAGTPWFPVIGTLIGAILGAFVGAALFEYIAAEKSAGAAMWTGLGAALGRVFGVFAKLLIGLAMLLVAALNFS